MNTVIQKSVLSIALISLIFLTGSAAADHDMSGELGVDILDYRFSNRVKEDNSFFKVNRSLSNHFLKLNFNGPVVNNNFANYVARTRFYGAYYQVNADAGKDTKYVDPDLRSLFTEMTLFPNRKYPLKFYHSNSRDLSLRYEQNNRSDIELIQPALAVIRRYESEKTSDGVINRVSVNEKISMLNEYKKDESESFRTYDFGEDKDIWVNITPGLPKQNTRDTITIRNEIPDSDIRVFIDGQDFTIAIGGELEIVVDSGRQEVEIVPLSIYNNYRFRIDIKSNMLWKVIYSEPGTPNDQVQTMTSFATTIRADGGEKYLNEAHFDYLDMGESIQGLTTFMSNFSNNATYKLNKKSNVAFLTTYSQNQTSVEATSNQLNSSLLHMSTYNYTIRGGFATSLSHAFSHNTAETEVDEDTTNLSSDMHVVNHFITLPSRKWNHRLDIKNNVNLLEDSQDYVNNQYSTTVTNRVGFTFMSIDIEPRNETKYAINNQKNPDKTSKEIDTKFVTQGEKKETLIGDIKISTTYNYRKKFDAIGSDIKNRYLLNMTISRKFGKKYKLMFLTSQELETYGGSTPQAGSNPDQNSAARESESKSSYKLDVQAQPAGDMFLGLNAMLISQKSTSIIKFGGSINVTIPFLDMPLKSFAIREVRKLTGLPTQTQFTLTTKATIQFRQIALVLTHDYVKENQVTNKYSFQEIQGTLSRGISFF